MESEAGIQVGNGRFPPQLSPDYNVNSSVNQVLRIKL